MVLLASLWILAIALEVDQPWFVNLMLLLLLVVRGSKTGRAGWVTGQKEYYF